MRLNSFRKRLYRKLKENKLVLVYIPLVIYWIVLFTGTTLPGKSVPKVSVSDKVKHLVAYFILATLVSLTLHFQEKVRKFKEKIVLWTLIIVGTYGILDELHQLFVPGRNCELLDWLADMTGSIIAVMITATLIRSGLLPDNDNGTKK